MKKFNLAAFVNRSRARCNVTHITTYPERIRISIEMVSGQAEYKQQLCITVNELNSLADPRYALARMLKDIRKSIRDLIKSHKDNQ